jgi:hypothetical protein
MLTDKSMLMKAFDRNKTLSLPKEMVQGFLLLYKGGNEGGVINS